MTRYRTTQAWADANNQGIVLEGTLYRLKKKGQHPIFPNRTYCLKLSEPFLQFEYLTFDPADLEEIED